MVAYAPPAPLPSLPAPGAELEDGSVLRGQNQISHPPADAGANASQQPRQTPPGDHRSAALGP